ncbi:MAG: hemin-degrading factor [Spirochaetales bacterium]
MSNTMTDTTVLAERWRKLKDESSSIRIRDAATKLGVSELELLVAAMQRPELHPELRALRITEPIPELFERIGELGRVMALSRNEAVVSETHGEYGEIKRHGNVAVVHTETIDLRVDFSHWHYGFVVGMTSHGRELESLQFFDSDGTAVHKIYLEEQSNRELFDQIKSVASAQSPELDLKPAAASPDARGRSEVDAAELQEGWRALTNVHQFTALLRRMNVTRLTALEAVGHEFARPAAPDAHRRLLQAARDEAIPIMVFVRSPGVTQIHSGPVERLSAHREYYNVLDPEFNLHIREPQLAQAWLVKKPTAEDTVTSIEIYDHDGELVLQFFGVRDDHGPEDSRWRELAESLLRE